MFLAFGQFYGQHDCYKQLAAAHWSVAYDDVHIEQRTHFKTLLFASMYGRPFQLPWSVQTIVKEYVLSHLMLAQAQAEHEGVVR
jgi:hypothetical protein